MQLEASRRCLPGGSSDSAATVMPSPDAPKQLSMPPTQMAFRDGRLEVFTTDVMADAHEEVDYVEEHGPALVNSASFINRISCQRWSHTETSLFYRVSALVFWQGAVQHRQPVVDDDWLGNCFVLPVSCLLRCQMQPLCSVM